MVGCKCPPVIYHMENYKNFLIFNLGFQKGVLEDRGLKHLEIPYFNITF